MKHFLRVLVVAAVFMATASQAEDANHYIEIRGGISVPTDLDSPGLSFSFDPGWNASAAGGYDWGDWRAEIEVGYRQADVGEINGVAVGSSVADVSALNFMVNGYHDHEFGNSPFSAYGGIGLGVAVSDLDVAGTDISETDVAYQAMLGLGYEYNQSVLMIAGYRFLGTADSDALDIHEFNIGLRFMF